MAAHRCASLRVAGQVTHEIPNGGDSLLDRGGHAGVSESVVDLSRDPREGLAGGRGEVVPQPKEVGEEQRGEQSAIDQDRIISPPHSSSGESVIRS